MSPESLSRSPKYSDELDVFSFGHLAIYLVNQEAPYVEDSTITATDVLKKQLQVGKRRTALNQMGGHRHPLYTTVVQCLSDTPDKRPTSRDLVRRMEKFCQVFSIPHKNTLELEKWNAQLKSSNQVYIDTICMDCDDDYSNTHAGIADSSQRCNETIICLNELIKSFLYCLYIVVLVRFSC